MEDRPRTGGARRPRRRAARARSGAAGGHGSAARAGPVRRGQARSSAAAAAQFSPSYAGVFSLDAPAAAAVYKVTLSSGGWIDLVQDGKFLKAINFSEATGCANARKSVEFRLAAEPAMLQLTGVGVPRS